jgi:hypothetical protein
MGIQHRMATGGALYQSPDQNGAVVPVGGNKRLPLLPYEKHLIDVLGCSEEEYRQFAEEAKWRGLKRPAGYEHIPDITCDPLTVSIVGLVVGLLSSAASFLLAPKPKTFQAAEDKRTQRQLASRTGDEKFSATSGFDSQAQLADYGSPIPIVFGRYTGATGGILASPSLVWSRVFSLGSQQTVKLLFVVGEQGLGEGLARPELNGIFLGNTPLDVIFKHDFAFYWKRNTNLSNRIKGANLGYGTRGSKSSGDFETNDDIFSCPTKNNLNDTGFSEAYSLSGNTKFGVYSAIANANNYRVNWRTISMPLRFTEDKSNLNDIDIGTVLLAERIKISGDYGLDPTVLEGQLGIRALAQQGVGRNYGRRMGITQINGIAANSPTEVRQVAVGNTATFTIAPGELPKNFYYIDAPSVSVDDINSEIESGRKAADDMLQVGETVMIGRTVWVVESRSLPFWTLDSRQTIGLKCVEIFGTGIGASVGIVNENMVTRGVYNDDNGTTNTRDGLGLNAGVNFYPLLRVAFGIVRNSRACDVTEIGIKSEVWQRAAGLCNFESLLSPSALANCDFQQVSVQSGTMTLYMERTSVWTIVLRPAGTDSNGKEYEWAPLGEQFCVTGKTPQQCYNFIRIKHPKLGQYEYKMVPKSGADVARHSPDTEIFWRLNAKQSQTLSGTYNTIYGSFEVYSAGELVTAKGVKFNPEMFTNVKINPGTISSTLPASIGVSNYLPDVEDDTTYASEILFEDWLPSGVTVGRAGATLFELFGVASAQGIVKSTTRTVNLVNGRSVTIECTGIVNSKYPDTNPYFPGQNVWTLQKITVKSSTRNFNTSEIFDFSIPVTAENERAKPYELATCGLRLKVSATSAGSIKGRQSAWQYELLGDTNPLTLGSTKSVTFTANSNSGGVARIIANGVVVSRPQESQARFPGQTKAWNVTYSIDPLGSYGTWVNRALIEKTAIVTAGNPFYKPGVSVGVQIEVLALKAEVKPPAFTADRAFEENSQVADLSLYNSLLTKSNENNPEHEIVYVNEMIANEVTPKYTNLTLAGLSLKASRNFTSLDQLRVWLADGIPVKKFQADAEEEIGSSNKFTDLVYYLLTDKTAGAGAIVSPELIKTEDFPATSQFLEQNKLFFDGALDQPLNLRGFIADTAPFFLCNFVISDGKFSLRPAIPTDLTGSISKTPLKISALFTSGNIIENSFSVEYLQAEERKDFQALIRYRQERRNQLPEEKTLVVRWAEAASEQATIETFDLTQFCTSRQHAFLVAKYFMSLRRRVTHSVKFRTTPYGISLAPGDYIRVLTEASPYQPANNGVIDESGNITSATTLADGSYSIIYYASGNEETKTGTLTVAKGLAVQPTLFNSVFTINNVTVSSNTYMVEQLTLGEDGLVDVVATEFPSTSTLNSLIALDLLTDNAFITEG